MPAFSDRMKTGDRCQHGEREQLRGVNRTYRMHRTYGTYRTNRTVIGPIGRVGLLGRCFARYSLNFEPGSWNLFSFPVFILLFLSKLSIVLKVSCDLTSPGRPALIAGNVCQYVHTRYSLKRTEPSWSRHRKTASNAGPAWKIVDKKPSTLTTE